MSVVRSRSSTHWIHHDKNVLPILLLSVCTGPVTLLIYPRLFPSRLQAGSYKLESYSAGYVPWCCRLCFLHPYQPYRRWRPISPWNPPYPCRLCIYCPVPPPLPITSLTYLCRCRRHLIIFNLHPPPIWLYSSLLLPHIPYALRSCHGLSSAANFVLVIKPHFLHSPDIHPIFHTSCFHHIFVIPASFPPFGVPRCPTSLTRLLLPRPYPSSHHLAWYYTRFDLPGWNVIFPPLKYPLPVPLDKTLLPLTARRLPLPFPPDLLRPNYYGRHCFFFNIYSVGAQYKRVVDVTGCCLVYLLLILSTFSRHYYCYLVSIRVLYYRWSSSSYGIVLRHHRPCNTVSLKSTVPHIYHHFWFTHIYNVPSLYCWSLSIPRLWYALGNLPGYSASVVMNCFVFPKISRM